MEDSMSKKIKQVNIWRNLGYTAPFTALAILIGVLLLDNPTITDVTICAMVISFFSVAVFWWWWAMDTLSHLIKNNMSTDERLQAIKQDIGWIRKTFDKLRNSNREWRK